MPDIEWEYWGKGIRKTQGELGTATVTQAIIEQWLPGQRIAFEVIANGRFVGYRDTLEDGQELAETELRR